METESIQLDKIEIRAQKKRKKRNRKIDPAYLLHQKIVANKKQNDFKTKAGLLFFLP